MAYEKRTWVNGDVITASKLNHIETGIGDAHDALATKLSAADIDDTLAVTGKPADAKAVGDALSEVDESLETKAEIDGAYETMTVGNAEQLVSTVYEEDQTPYVFRTAGGSIDIGDRMIDKLVGGSIAWNQICKALETGNWAAIGTGATLTFSNGVATFTSVSPHQRFLFTPSSVVGNHKYLLSTDFKGYSGLVSFTFGIGTQTTLASQGCTLVMQPTDQNWNHYETIKSLTEGTDDKVIFQDHTGSGESQIKNANIFDLTQMFGSAVADYIYALETAHAGAGVAFFKKLFPKDYYAYNAGTLMHVSGLQSHDIIGFNAYNPTTGTAKLIGGNEYQITGTYTSLSLDGTAITPDANGKFTPSANGTLTVTGGGADTCIHLVWDGERDGDYEEYVKHSYPLDSDLVLRGIPKLDASNNLYFDGDVYEADGTVTRKYGIVDLGTLDWVYQGAEGHERLNSANAISDLKGAESASIANIICAKYKTVSNNATYSHSEDKTISAGTTGYVYVYDSLYTDAAAFKSAMSGVYLVYELATPTTETADPFTNPQIVDDFGTEEYVVTTEADVIVPVGHVTQYQANLRAKLEMLPDSPDGDGDYVVRHSNGKNTYVAVTKELPTVPSEDGTYVLKCTVSDGTATLSWESAT